MELFVFWILLSIIVGVAASSRGRSGFGWFLLSLFLTPVLMLILVLVLPRRGLSADAPSPDTHIKCPDCAELIKKEARVCKHCGCRLAPS